MLALGFGLYIARSHGSADASLYLTGWLLEKSLSVDNLFVMMAIFANFSVPDKFQHRVLYYGILGALFFRLIFVALGASLLALFGPWALLAFGLFVLWSAWKMAQAVKSGSEEITDYANHWAVRGARRLMPVSSRLDGHNFFSRVDGRAAVTPLFLCLLAVETADIMFAFDSVPAVFGVTTEPFLVYTSNIFAILGLRSLYFLLAAARRWLRHLDKAVVAILAFIGLKMLADVSGELLNAAGILTHAQASLFHLPGFANLAVVGLLLAGGVAASLILPDGAGKEEN